MSNPPGSQLYNYDANGNAKVALVNGSGGFTTVANMAALQALAASSISDGQMFMLQTDGSRWRYAAASVLTSDTGAAAGPVWVATATTAGVGAFIRVSGLLDAAFTIGFGTADAAVLYTVPTGFTLRIDRTYYEIATSFTGGTNSAIGASSTNAAYNTKGDIQGGSGGDVASALVSTGGAFKAGTQGAKYGSNGVVVLVGGNAVRFDQIASTFTAGAGKLHVQFSLVYAPAA